MEDGYLLLRNRARAMRREMTPAERRLWQALRLRRCHNLRFIRQHVVDQYILDFYCPHHNLGVEVDGAIHQRPDVQHNDMVRTATLQGNRGLRIVRFTNEDILHGSPTLWYAKIMEAIWSPEEISPS